jgi:hypothetical protein
MGPDGRAQSPPGDQSPAVGPADHPARAGGGHRPQAASSGLFCAADACPDGRGEGQPFQHVSDLAKLLPHLREPPYLA